MGTQQHRDLLLSMPSHCAAAMCALEDLTIPTDTGNSSTYLDPVRIIHSIYWNALQEIRHYTKKEKVSLLEASYQCTSISKTGAPLATAGDMPKAKVQSLLQKCCARLTCAPEALQMAEGLKNHYNSYFPNIINFNFE